MSYQKWDKEFNGAVTVCDKKGKILYMNDKACKTFEKYGGEDLVGKSLFDCHPESANNTLKDMIVSEKSNAYTIEKNGVKKLIYQMPWYIRGKFKGLVELSLEIPIEMPNFIR